MASSGRNFTPQHLSRLLSLAGELKNRIYRLAIVEEASINVEVLEMSRDEKTSTKTLALQSALLLVCKQTRFEAGEIYWVENNFTLTEDAFHPQPLAKLRGFFQPYMEKICNLSISHELVSFAHPHYPLIQVDLDIVKLEGAVTLDGTKPLAKIAVPPSVTELEPAVCTCVIADLAFYNNATDVLEWTEEYVELLSVRKEGPRGNVAEKWCWTCAGLKFW